MKKKMRISIFFIMGLYGFILFPVYAQPGMPDMNHPRDWEEIVGKIESLNLDTSLMVVKSYSDEKMTSFQEITILITREAKIVKNDQAFALEDLKTGDEISVRYIVTAKGQKAAYYLWVK